MMRKFNLTKLFYWEKSSGYVQFPTVPLKKRLQINCMLDRIV